MGEPKAVESKIVEFTSCAIKRYCDTIAIQFEDTIEGICSIPHLGPVEHHLRRPASLLLDLALVRKKLDQI